MDTQQLLRDREMHFVRKHIDLDEIDADASTRNQARLLPVHQETVEIYRAAMEAGDKFPPIVVNGTKKPYVVLDGNHRLFAAKMAGFSSMDAFVVTQATKAQMELFTYEANAKHGLPTSITERVRQGMYLVSLGNTASVVAKALSIPERRLWEALQSMRAEKRLVKFGMDPARFSQNIKRRLASVHSDVVLEPFAQVIIGASLNTDEINEAVTKINTLNSEAEQLAYVESLRVKYESILQSTAGGAIDLPPDVVRLRMAARLLRRINEDTLAESIDRVSPEFRTVLAREVIESVSALLTASGLLKTNAEG
jgi:hypothetical protein